MKQFVIGDIHGQADALEQCLRRSGFDNKHDTLICLGDVCDRGSKVKESIEILLAIKNLKYILGNHDQWFLEWACDGKKSSVWKYQGGRGTMNSYRDGVPENHISLLLNAPKYYITDNKLFVHAGIDPSLPIDKQEEDTLLWDRDLVYDALDYKDDNNIELKNGFDEIYVGHTAVTNKGFNSDVPLNLNGIWMMDTGAGFSGKLSIMDIDTKEVWQSNKIK